MGSETGGLGQADFVSHIRAQVARYSRTRSYTYLRGAGRELVEEIVTFEDLDRDARTIAAWLATRPERDRPVLLLYVDGIEFLRGLPRLPVRRRGRGARSAAARRAQHAADGRDVRRCRHRPRAHDGRTLPQLTAWAADSGLAGRVTFVATDAEPLGDPGDWRMPELTGETVAFLQYTSGSTSEPKGVMVTHANLLHNSAVIADALELGRRRRRAPAGCRTSTTWA